MELNTCRSDLLDTLHKSGTCRIVFNEDQTEFRGVLIDKNGECVSVHGVLEKLIDSAKQLMRISIVDDETGSQFQIENVQISFKCDTNCPRSQFPFSINNPSIQFGSTRVLHGYRADKEVMKFLNREMIPTDSTLSHTVAHIGQMTIDVCSNVQIHERSRRESQCSDCNVKVLTNSSDFLS